MTPKKKALELFHKYAKMWQSSPDDTKQCCRIAVEELINMARIYDNHNVKTDKHIYTFECVVYWQEVMSEIEEL